MAPEGFDMIKHISKLKNYQDDLHIMENLVTDKDFVMILIMSLPDSWDKFTGSFFGYTGNKPMIGSYKLILVLLDEDQRRKAQSKESLGTALLSKGKDKQGANKDKECYNCEKKGHILLDCWAKGGGKKDQGPKGRKGAGKRNKANQVEEVNLSLKNACYMARNSCEISKYNWLLNSGTTSHICTICEAFTEFSPIEEMINGVGDTGTAVAGHGTIKIKFEFDGKTFIHQLCDTLYVPNVPNCLLSLSQIDNGGGSVDFNDGIC